MSSRVIVYTNPLSTHPDREAIHVNNFGLTDAVYSINSLELYSRVPPKILKNRDGKYFAISLIRKNTLPNKNT